MPVFRKRLLICMFAFPFGSEGGMRNKIAIFPDHRLSVFFTTKYFIRVAQSVARQTQDPEVPGQPHTFGFPCFKKSNC